MSTSKQTAEPADDMSLSLTKEVLEERRQLEATVEGLQPKIQAGLSKLEGINSTKDALQNSETYKKEKEDFIYEVEVDKYEKINLPSGTFVTNCHVCNFTCLYPCYIQKDEYIRGCSAMSDGYCTVCPNKCHWSQHANMTYRWDIKRVTEKKTYQDLKRKYEAAMGMKNTTEKIIKQLEEEYDEVQETVAEMMDDLTKCLQRLGEIALRPDPLSTPGYIDLLIEAEKREAKDGYQKRLAELQNLRGKAVILQKMAEEKTPRGKKSPRKGIFNNVVDWLRS